MSRHVAHLFYIILWREKFWRKSPEKYEDDALYVSQNEENSHSSFGETNANSYICQTNMKMQSALFD